MNIRESMQAETCVNNAQGVKEDELPKFQKMFDEKYGIDIDDKKIHIVFIGGDMSGCGYVRMDLPAKYLNRVEGFSAISTIKIVPEIVNWGDIFVWQRQHRDDLIPVYELIKQRGKISIFELDDNLHAVPPSNPAYFFYNPKTKHFHDMISWIKRCSRLQVTRANLGEFYKQKYGIDYIVLPNCIDLETLPQIQKNESDKLRIGWVGSSTHEEDLALIVYAIKELKKEFDFDFVMMGWDGVVKMRTPNKSIVEIKDLFGGVERERHDFCEIEKYMETLSSLRLDIGLAPVVDNNFNNFGKSGIKYFEYSSQRIPTVASKVSCYSEVIHNGEDGILVKREGDWYGAIKKLILDKELRSNMADKAYNNTRDNFDIAKNINKWAEFYQNEYYKKHGKWGKV